MPRSRKAAAVRQLAPCHSSLQENIGGRAEQPACPSWGLTTLGPSPRQRQQHQRDVFGAGLTGQAVLALPLKNVDVSVRLPPGLQLAATPAGHLDCRMQLMGVHMDWPAAGAAAGQQDDTPQHRVLPARSSVAGFACRTGALMLAHALFPDHTQHLLAWLAVPVAAADGLAVLASATPEGAQQALQRKAGQLKGRLQQQRSAGQGIGWVDGVQGVVDGSLHAFRSLSGPAAAMATGSWLWSLVSPSSHMLCSAVVALMAVAADYNSLGRDVAKGRIPPGKAVEAAWRARHKAAAQRLAVFCSDLPSQPPLAPVVQLASYCSIAAGLAFDGQGLSGQLPSSLCGPTASLLHPAGGPVGCSSSSSRGVQLVVSGSAAGHAAAEVHAAAGLSRAQLLELFTGSTQDTAEALPPAESAVCAGAEQGAAAAAVLQSSARIVAAGRLGAGQPLAAAGAAGLAVDIPVAAAAPGLDSLRVSTDSGSEKSVDAVIRIKQPAHSSIAKPAAAQANSSSSSSGTTAVSASILRTSSNASSSSSTAGGPDCSSTQGLTGAEAALPAVADPLAFLDTLPLYGQQDHAHLLATEAAAAAAADGGGQQEAGAQHSLELAPAGGGDQHSGLSEWVRLSVRGVYLLLVFAPFLLLGAPMLFISWWLLTRAAAAQQHQVTPPPGTGKAAGTGSSTDGASDSGRDCHSSSVDACGSSSSSKLAGMGARVRQLLVQHPQQLGAQLLQQLWRLVVMLFALLDVLLVLMLGGHWAAGVSAWESAGLWLRRQAWVLLHFSCSNAGPAFIKWGQWSSSRRDIFPADFCDALSTFHDRAPVHSYRHSRREIKAALGVEVEQLFDDFDPQPLASGSIAQVHRATLKPAQYRQYLQQQHPNAQQQQQSVQCADDQQEQQQEQQVVVKVCHPNVAQHIRLDFKLVGWLSIAASKLPLLRGLPVRESVAQFSHTMTAQTDLRVEAVHALRFHNNFAGVSSSVSIPQPIPGLVASTVLVESFEAGRSVAVFMREPHAINTQIVALGVDAYLKMLLTDNFVHTDLHPGNILFRSVPIRQAARKRRQRAQQAQQRKPPLWQRLLPRRRPGSSSGAEAAAAAAADAAAAAAAEVPQWELELQALSAQNQQRWASKHGAPAGPRGGSNAQQQQEQAADEDSSSDSSSGSSTQGPQSAQLVLLDFGLAEQLTDTVRHHFISFLNAISAGDGLAAAHHLLRWSGHQTCPDRRAFGSDMVDLFHAACDIHSPQGIDLDYVMQAVLGLARKHGVAIDSCYASLVISVCVLVGFGKALDPEVNLMDAATPTLLAYALTGKVVGRLYS